jgi:hypothetical protein
MLAARQRRTFRRFYTGTAWMFSDGLRVTNASRP